MPSFFKQTDATVADGEPTREKTVPPAGVEAPAVEPVAEAEAPAVEPAAEAEAPAIEHATADVEPAAEAEAPAIEHAPADVEPAAEAEAPAIEHATADALAQELADKEAAVKKEAEEIQLAQERMQKAQEEAEATRKAMLAAQQEEEAAAAAKAEQERAAAAAAAAKAAAKAEEEAAEAAAKAAAEQEKAAAAAAAAEVAAATAIGLQVVSNIDTPAPQAAEGRRTRVPTPLPRVASLSNFGASRPSLSGSASAQSLYSVRKTAPSFGFGSGTREQAGKVTGQPERLLGAFSPGPGAYNLTPAIGVKQPASRSVPQYGFMKAGRFSYGYGKSDDRPGPESQNVPPSIGGKHPSKPSTPMFSMGGRARAPVEAGLSSPGPAAYLLPPSVGGAQAEARKKGAPMWTVKGRDGIRKGIEPDPGWESPGAIYNVPRGIGKQPDAAVRSEPQYSFSSKARTPVAAGGDAPGPIYNLPSAVERQVEGRKRSGPTPTFSRYSRWATLEAEQKRNSVPGPGTYG